MRTGIWGFAMLLADGTPDPWGALPWVIPVLAALVGAIIGAILGALGTYHAFMRSARKIDRRRVYARLAGLRYQVPQLNRLVCQSQNAYQMAMACWRAESHDRNSMQLDEGRRHAAHHVQWTLGLASSVMDLRENLAHAQLLFSFGPELEQQAKQLSEALPVNVEPWSHEGGSWPTRDFIKTRQEEAMDRAKQGIENQYEKPLESIVQRMQQQLKMPG